MIYIIIFVWFCLCVMWPEKNYKKEEERIVKKVLELQRMNGWIK